MSRKTTARRGAISVLAATALSSGFALGIADAAADDPVVSALSTSVVKAGAATNIVVTGKNFNDVSVEAKPASGSAVDLSDFIWKVSDTQFVVEVPGSGLSSLAAGKYDIVVTHADGASKSANTAKDDLLAVGAVVNAKTPVPASVNALTGGTVTLSADSGLGGASQVFVYEKVGGALVGASKLGKGTDTSLPVTLPKGLPFGTLELKVVTPQGGEQLVGEVTTVRALASAAPNRLHPAGGQSVLVKGAGFKGLAAYVPADAGTSTPASGPVKIKGVPVDFVVLSDTEMQVRIPAALDIAASAGETVKLTVEDTAVNVSLALTYVPMPQVTPPTFATQLLPNGGGNVTLAGKNLAGAKVLLNGKPAALVSATAEQVVFKAPKITNPSRIVPVLVSVSTKTGSQDLEGFFYAPGLTVTSGTVDGRAVGAGHAAGDTLRIVGKGFSSIEADDNGLAADSAVTFGSVDAARVTVLSDTVLEVEVPTVPATTMGTSVTVTVENADEVAKTLAGFTFAPQSTITPQFATIAAAADGATLTLAGTGLDRLPASGAFTVANSDGTSYATAVSYTRSAGSTTLTFGTPFPQSGGVYILTMTPASGFGPADSVTVTVEAWTP